MDSPYASRREVTDRQQCLFYHTMDLPGPETVVGSWDLRPGIDRYLGGMSFRGKRVLDIGAASGFLSFHMERQGAEVVSYDLSDADSWDLVPYAGTDLAQQSPQTRASIRRLNDGYWYCHRALKSANRIVYGSVYAIPAQIGSFDIGVFGSVLQHLRDPFLALQTGLAMVKDTVIVVETIPRRRFWQRWLPWLIRAEMGFLPHAANPVHDATWWILPPRLVQRFLGVLGFEDTWLTYHSQRFEGSRRLLYTMVGKRTRPASQLCPLPTPVRSVA
jgi:2-polyprenyl-3-methyl-5-hydroxy-6-metoxy-1,4-benzoquinol methylase